MKQLGLFLETTTLGGLFKTVGIIRDAATKIISLITDQVPDAVHFPIVLALLLVLAVSFLAGLILTARVGSQSSHGSSRPSFSEYLAMPQ